VTIPDWLRPLADEVPRVKGEHFTRFLPPASGGRDSAVLILFAEGPEGPDLLLIERAATMRSHAGQPAFPGGAQDPEDDGPVAAALREAEEEVGLDPATVEVVATLPTLWIPVSNFLVTPVVAWWRSPHPVGPADPREVARVERLPIRDLIDPANRLRVRHPSGWIGPAFRIHDMLVWGFTAGVVSTLLELGGWAIDWPTDRVEELPTPGAATVR
jgi:8-oxo-dGTP pyrophosphatase MutT (NUDIX family)